MSKCNDIYLSSFVHCRFATYMPFYGLILHLQHIGNNVFLFQVLFGMVNLPANYVAFLALNHMGRRVSQTIFMSLLGISILTTTFLPEGEKRVQVKERKYLRDLGTRLTQGKGEYRSNDSPKLI